MKKRGEESSTLFGERKINKEGNIDVCYAPKKERWKSRSFLPIVGGKEKGRIFPFFPYREGKKKRKEWHL